MSQTTTYAGSARTNKTEIETSTIRAISWRLIPFLVLAYAVGIAVGVWIDRLVGWAKAP